MINYRGTSWLPVLLALAGTTHVFIGRAGAATDGKAPGTGPDLPAHASASVFLSGGSLGMVLPTSPTLIEENPNEVKLAAADALQDILQEHFGFTGQESLVPISAQPIRVDKEQTAHIRLKQYVDGLPLEGASLAIHFDARTGQVFAANGEVHSSDSIVSHADAAEYLDCVVAVEMALAEYTKEIAAASLSDSGEWKGECELAAVQGRDGKPYLAYKRLFEIQPDPMSSLTSNAFQNTSVPGLSEPYRLDLLFADRVTGQLVAIHPKATGSRTMITYDCNNLDAESPSDCIVVTTSPNKISTGDPPLDDAHNDAIDVYDFYLQQFGLVGIDGNDLQIQSLAHYGSGYNNAFFTSEFGGIFVYGDGDGVQYSYFARLDVVAHEYSHGVTFFTSNLVYAYESGALNEAFSDVMAAAAERLVKNTPPFNVWHIGEELDIVNGVGFRNMANPPDFGDPDYFANRYLGGGDNGGVHFNSGIMNKAFYLMVAGGTHPVSGIVVPPLSSDFDTSIKQAASIFYNANTMCLTESSDFMAMRECTLLFASAAQTPTVQKAWDAVGLKTILPLTPGVRLTGLNLPYDKDVQVFQLDRTVGPGESVTCSLFGDNGDPDLSVKFGRSPSLFPFSYLNDCYSNSITGNETCTTGRSTAPNTKVFLSVESYEAANNIELICIVNAPRTCKNPRARCTSRQQCCRPARNTCDGPRASARVCKACKARRAACSRTSECCTGRCTNRRCR